MSNKPKKSRQHSKPVTTSYNGVADDDDLIMEKALLAQMMYKAGCSPEEYASFCGHISNGIKDGSVSLEAIPAVTELLHALVDARHRLGEGPSPDKMLDLIENMDEDDSEAFEDGFDPGPSRRHIIAPAVLAEADKKTLVLRIQLDYVTKPPMWRKVEVPADMTFDRLHRVIQCVMGWDGGHLHQFVTKTAFIGDTSMDDDFGGGPDLDDTEVVISQYLRAKGDKLKYEYDFGDGWEHTVSVLEVKDEVCEAPKLLQTKGGKPVEDCGGALSLVGLRELAAGKGRMSADDRDRLEWLGCSSRPELAQLLADPVPEEVNEILKNC